MASASRAITALLTEHFRYTPLTLIDDIINAVNTIIYRGVEAIETGLLNIPPNTLGFPSKQEQDGENTAAADEIEHGVHQLETLLGATADKAFDKFEIYTLRNILTVPEDVAPWVRLSHYEDLEFPSSTPNSKSPPAPTPETLLQLRRQLAETRKLNAALRATHAQNAALLSDLTSLLSPSQIATTGTQAQPDSTSTSLSFLARTHPIKSTSASTSTTSGTTATATPLTTNAQFITSQLPALRQLVAELRPWLQKVQQSRDKGVDWEGKREERRRYIESGVARVLRRGGGVGTGGMEMQDGAERRGAEEVEALEGLVRGGGSGMDTR